ncbi:hypothetical protein LNKW23_05960 [Paralimibaculum aggregatum]|uniref:Polysaccharide biosynthesis protein n=1 Tax=Paralimibaculum aggregatum TaxID=3036245 RepID=A0ABQ6LKR5_9RHOB|nr:oligosaccharide flippase family protein [Limibaculum sp. NKW23]GMG81383.1 hypothetical protein LNKW23_05960 [Limibaculum sp. NKW23]
MTSSPGLRGALLLNGAALAGLALRLGHLVIVARLVPPEAVGLAAMAWAVAFMVGNFTDMGMSSALVRETRDTADLAPLAASVFWLQAGVGLALAAAVALAAGPLAAVYDEPRAAPLILLAAVMIPAGAMAAVPWSLLQRAQRFGRIALCDTAAQAIATAVSLALAWAGHGATALVMLLVVQYPLRAGLLLAAAGFRPRFRIDRAEIARIWPYSRSLLGAQILGMASLQIDRAVLGARLGAAGLGLYHQGRNLAMMPLQLLAWGSAAAMFPVFARYGADRAGMAAAYTLGSRVLAAAAFPVYAGMAALADPLVAVMLGRGAGWDWSPVAALLPVMALAGAVKGALGMVGAALMALGRSDRMMAGEAVTLVAMVTGIWIGAGWGPEGAAWGYLAAVIVQGAVMAGLSLTALGLGAGGWLAALARPGLAALVMGIAVHLLAGPAEALTGSEAAALALLVPGGACLYAVLLALIDRDLIRRALALALRRGAGAAG